MRFGIDISGMDDVMKSLRQLGRGVNSYELAQWASIIENTTRHMCYEVKDNIEIKAQDNVLHFRYEDERSKDCLLRAIQRHLNLMPTIIQSIFRKLASDLESGAYTQSGNP